MTKFSKFLVALTLLFSTGAVCAKDVTAIKTTNVFDNWYIGPKIGLSTNLKFSPVFPINTAAGLKIGKMISPAVGVNAEGTVLFGSADYKGGRFSYKNAVRGLNVGGNIDVDVPNLFVQKPRKFTVFTETGLGWFHTFNTGSDQNDLSAKVGLFAGFNTSKAIQFYVGPAIYWNLTKNDNTPQFKTQDAQFAIEAGFVYRLRNHDGSRGYQYYNITELNDNINKLRGDLSDSEKKYAELKAKKPLVVHDTIYVEQPVTFFAQGDYSLTDTSVYDNFKAGDKVKVYGYASPEGSKKFNLNLSQKRADVVADYLKSKGVEVIESKGLGVVGKNSNRVAIVKIEK